MYNTNVNGLYIFLNSPRIFLLYVLVRFSHYRDDIYEDIKRFAYGSRKHNSIFLTFSHVVLRDKCFRNILGYRFKKESFFLTSFC